MNGQTIYAEIERLEKSLAELAGMVSMALTEYCKDAVDASGVLAHLLYTTDPERQRRAITDALATNGQTHDGHKAWLVVACDALRSAEIDLLKLRTDFRATWNINVEAISQAKDTAKEHQSKLAELKARIREHAINSPEVRKKVWAMTNGHCAYCAVELTWERKADEPHICFEVDHIVAKANGGPDHLSNYVPACAKCNGHKSGRPLFHFLNWREPTDGARKLCDAAFGPDRPDLKVVGGTEP